MADAAPEIKVKLTAEDTGVAAAIRELGTQLQGLKANQDAVAGSADRMGNAEAGAGRSMREAREAARLLSEETGVRLGRSLGGVIARSETLGPLLNMAFPVAAAIGFGEVIAHGTEKLTSLIANTFIYTAAMQAEYSAQIAANREIEASAEKIKQLKLAYDLIGLKGSALGEAKLTQLKKETDDAIKELDRLKAKQIEVEQPGLASRVVGGVLSAVGINTGLGIPDPQPAIDAKAREVGLAQEKTRVLNQEQLNQEKELANEKAEEAKAAADKAKALQDQINKARLSQIEAGFANELSLYKAEHSQEDQENEASYQKGLESLAGYYTRKKQLAAEEAQKEIDALVAERERVLAAPTKDKAQEIENQTKAAALQNQIDIARINASKTQTQLTNEQGQKQEELDRKVLEFQSQIAKGQGARFDEASEKIEAEALTMAKTLREAGISPEQVDAMVAKFKAAATQQAQFASMKTSGKGAIADLSSEEEDIKLKNTAIVAEEKIRELELSRIPVLQQLAANMRDAAVTPDQIKAADDYSKEVDKLAISAQKNAVSWHNFENEAGTALKGDLTSFLSSTIDHVHGVGDAFRQLASSAVASIQRIIAQMLVQIITQKLVQKITGDDAGASGVATAAAKGTAQAAPLMAAATAMSASGVVIGTSAAALGVSAVALQVAADTLMIANSTGGGGVGVAGRGLIRGPGSATSDSIPARLSDGEFVVRSAAVRAFGVQNLAAINRGLHVPAITGLSTPRFAEGGLVQSGGDGGGSMDLRLGIGLDEGLILKHLASKRAGRVILRHLSDNPKAATRALQRGQ